MPSGPEERPSWRDHPAESPGLASGESRTTDRVNGTDWPAGDPWSAEESGDWVPPGWPVPVRYPRRPLQAALVAVAVAVGAALLGLPYGLLWAKLAPEPVLFKVNGGFYPQS